MPPSVSIIVPCYNEEATIGLLLNALLQQTYPRSDMEVIVADGRSQDGTRDVIAAFQQTHPDLQVHMMENACRSIPSGLNLAGRAARGEFLIRLDAHCMPIPEYVERCVKDLDQSRGGTVGGVWEIQAGGTGFVAEGIARAASHPLGVGDAMYRLGASEGAVDTVPFGAFRRTTFEALGGFDETLLTNEDYEFNTRLRQRGELVWLDPQIRSIYIARATLSSLARQYWRYGFWKLKMLQRHPGSIRWRQALPPAFVASLVVLGLLALFLPPARFLLLAEIVIYAAVLAAAGLVTAIRQGRPLLMPGLVLAIATMHLAWGSGFLWSLLSARPNQNG
jgi:succinoglycan biosynthesis protein ExoA